MGERKELTYRLADDSNPTWSPDGTRIAFQSDRDGIEEIYVIEIACADQPTGCPEQVERLTNNVADDLAPAWSPDGESIAFMSSRTGNLELYIMNADGTQPRRLTYNAGVDGFPTWSPDGTMLAYHSERDGNLDIYVMTLDRQVEWRLTNLVGEDIVTPAFEGFPSCFGGQIPDFTQDLEDPNEGGIHK